ncbi:MAG: hypothetical protein QXF76_00680 [Candidatus Anstonellales archaeon]
MSQILIIRNDHVSSIDYEISKNQAYEENIKTLDMLLRSKGIPKDWENNITNLSNYYEIGLVYEELKLSRKKIEKFCEANYSDLKKILGKTHDFYLQVLTIDDSIIYNCGKQINITNVRLSIANSRFAILDNEIVKLMVVSYVE